MRLDRVSHCSGRNGEDRDTKKGSFAKDADSDKNSGNKGRLDRVPSPSVNVGAKGVSMMKEPQLSQAVRPPVQAGRFYEADPQRLRRHIEQLLQQSPPLPREETAIALMAPHAGYLYSGRVAAAAYQTVQGRPIDHVLILGPSHYGDFIGAALPSHGAFATPLGEVPVDREAVHELAEKPYFIVDDAVHATEHAIEVQLPFLQVVLPAGFKILPLACAHPPRQGLEPLAEELLALLQRRGRAGEHWLIVASTDTYHGYDAQACLDNDERLQDLVRGLSAQGVLEGTRSRQIMACGWLPLALTMMLAQKSGARRGVTLRRSDSRSESTASGDYVVGYLAAAFV